MKEFIQTTLMAVGIITLFALTALAIFVPDRTDMEMCESITVEWSGLAACNRDGQCNLDNDEMLQMYSTGKNSTIICARAETQARFDAIRRIEEEKKAAAEEENAAAEEPEPEPTKPEIKT